MPPASKNPATSARGCVGPTVVMWPLSRPPVAVAEEHEDLVRALAGRRHVRRPVAVEIAHDDRGRVEARRCRETRGTGFRLPPPVLRRTCTSPEPTSPSRHHDVEQAVGVEVRDRDTAGNGGRVVRSRDHESVGPAEQHSNLAGARGVVRDHEVRAAVAVEVARRRRDRCVAGRVRARRETERRAGAGHAGLSLGGAGGEQRDGAQHGRRVAPGSEGPAGAGHRHFSYRKGGRGWPRSSRGS